MIDWTQLTLFLYICMRMSGFVLFSPLFGRSNVPTIVRAGLILVLSASAVGITSQTVAVPGTLIELALRLLSELALGYVLGYVTNLFFSIPALAGEAIDTQMGMTMAKTYDAGSQSSVSITARLINILMVLLFFAANGHLTLMRIILTSGEVVSYGAVSLGVRLVQPIADIFVECILLSVKLALPILAAELMGQVGMGILMKVIPQINVFAINIELKVLVGLTMLLILISPFSEFLLDAETTMLRQLRAVLALASA